MGSMSSYNIAGLISGVSEEVATQIPKNCRRQQPHSHLRSPPSGTPAIIRIYLIFPETRDIGLGLHFCRCMYGSIFIQIGAVGSKRRICSAPECVGRSRSFRVIQGRWFWYQLKARTRLPISRSLWLWSRLAPFLRYGDLLAKNCLFFLPLSHSAPSLHMLPLEFCAEVNREETRVMGPSSSEDPMIVAWVVLTQCQRVTDRRTDLL